MLLKFERDNEVIIYDKVIIGNKRTGYWVRISKEVYSILRYAIDNNYSEKELLEAVQNVDDKEYMNNLLNNMNVLGLLCQKNSLESDNKKVTFEITNSCNLSCNHCCMDTNHELDKSELNTNDLYKAINKVLQWKPNIIEISGGEPLIRPDFKNFLSFIKSNYNGEIYLDTNGLLIDENNIEFLIKHINQINISLDGVDEETCAEYRGKGVFAKVIEKIELLKVYGFKKITLSMVATDKNSTKIQKFYELNEKLGTKPIIRGLAFIGRAESNYDFLENTNKNEVFIPNSFFDKENKTLLPFYNCKAGKTDIFIRYNGYIYSCPNLLEEEYKMGNIVDIDSIEELQYKNLDLFVGLDNSQFATNYCNNCKVKMFCWTCPGKIHEFLKREAMESYCNQVKKELYRRVWEE